MDTKYDFTILQQILLHLLPGIALALGFGLFAWIAASNGLPSFLGFFTASVLVQFPIMLGLPLLIEKNRNNELTFHSLIRFHETKPVWQLVLLAIGVLLWSALVFLVLSSILVEPVQEAFFAWLPDWLDLAEYLSDEKPYSNELIIGTWSIGLLFVVFLGPVIEELYFRGYLLPRMSYLKAWAPLFGAVLMSVYHFWSPWLILLRIVAMLPLVYAVWWKRSVYIGIVAHCTINLIDWLFVIPLVFS